MPSQSPEQEVRGAQVPRPEEAGLHAAAGAVRQEADGQPAVARADAWSRASYVGLVWIALYYVTQSDMPGLRTLGGWNLVCGFALIVVGVVLATQWH